MKHNFLSQVLVVVSAVLMLEGAFANTFGKDRREQQSPELEHNRSVGQILNKNGYLGSAFLAEDECTVMSNYHVAFAKEKDPVTGNVKTYRGKKGERSEFMVGRNGSGPLDFQVKIGATVADFGTFSKNDARGLTGDYVVYRLDECVGEVFGFLKVKKADLDTQAEPVGQLKMISFGSSTVIKPGVAVEECRARDNGPAWGLVGVDCTFERGVSGAPLMEKQPSGEWLVVGIASTTNNPVQEVLQTYSQNHRNVMVYASAWNAALENVVREAREQRAHKNFKRPVQSPRKPD